MRKPTDKCLLCLSNDSKKKNSHIFPKFLSINLLGPKQSRKGFQITSDKSILNHKIPVQDSPKDDYILCPECEKYLGVLETVSSSFFNNWRSNMENSSYNFETYTKDFSLLQYNNPNRKSLKLLIYSIFWRASISDSALFNNIKIDKDFETKLRKLILSFKTTKHQELSQLLKEKPQFEVFPFTIITADSFINVTANILHVPVYNSGYGLIIDQYAFLLFRDQSDVPEELFKWGGNLKMDDCKMLVFSTEYWYNTIIKPALYLFYT